MADVSKEQLREEIQAILKDADLSATSAKKVRLQLEEKHGESLAQRKKEIDELVTDYVNSRDDGSDENKSEEDGTDEEEAPKKKAVKRSAPAKKTNSKKSKGASSSEEGSEPEEGSNESDDEAYSPKKPVPKKKAPKKKGKGSDSDSDSDWGKGGGGGGRGKKAAGGRGKGGGYTRAYKLSPELAALMGKESMARHEVVKKMWALIKERNLYDPHNKQFAICDDELMKVIGTKRFRTFGMMKYLKSHFN